MATKINYTNIFIIGFSGSGKSVIGKKISKQLKLSFIDTDREIELLENKEIHQIIEKKGEPYFRALETKILKKINHDISNAHIERKYRHNDEKWNNYMVRCIFRNNKKKINWV